MIEIAGTWELGWSAPTTEMVLWWAVMRSYDITKLHMTPRSGLRHRLLEEHDNWDSILDTSLTPVFVDEKANCELRDFQHPEKALYIFGKAAYSPFSNLAKNHCSIRIDCPKLGMLWPHQALAVVMNDRCSK